MLQTMIHVYFILLILFKKNCNFLLFLYYNIFYIIYPNIGLYDLTVDSSTEFLFRNKHNLINILQFYEMFIYDNIL